MPEAESAQTPSPPQPQSIPDLSRLSYAETALVLRLSLEGLTQTQIAKRLDCSQPTVWRILNEFQDTRELAKSKLYHGSLGLAKRIVADADVDQSIDVLERIAVLEPKQNQSGPVGVQILIGMPTAAAGSDPVLLVSDSGSGSHNDHYQTQSKIQNSTQIQAQVGPEPVTEREP